MKINKAASLLLMILGIFCACSDKDVEKPGSTTDCPVVKAVAFAEDGEREDSATYNYTGNKVSKVEFSDGEYFTLQYNGELVTRRSFYAAGATSPGELEQVTYNSDNTISKIEYASKAGTGYAIYYRSDFTYSSGKLTRLTLSSISNGQPSLEEEYTYTYTGNNITTADYIDHTTLGLTFTITYTYDSNINYLNKQNSQYLFTDPYLGSVDGSFLPIIISGNNVTSFSVPGFNYQVGYDTDDKQKIQTVKINNQPAIMYQYKCN